MEVLCVYSAFFFCSLMVQGIDNGSVGKVMESVPVLYHSWGSHQLQVNLLCTTAFAGEPQVITLSHEVADRDIAGEVLIAYQATCSITAKLLQGNIETEKINEEIVPRINVLHQAVLQSLTSYGIDFPKTPYDFSKPETIIGN